MMDKVKRITAAFMAFLITVTLFTISVSAENGITVYPEAFYPEKAEKDCSAFLAEPIELSKDKSAEVAVNVPVNGEYEVALVFRPTNTNAQEVTYSLRIDNELPFANAELLTANVLFCDDGERSVLSNGDEIPADQKQVDGFISAVAYDKTGVMLDPYVAKLTAGNHIFKITCLDNNFLFAGVVLNKPQELKSYKEVSADYKDTANYKGEQIVIQAEDSLYRNAYSITAKSDTGSADLSPKSATNSIINYIGGTTWSSPGNEIAWEIDVPKDGLYRIGFSFKQNTIINASAWRTLKIDGQIPFEEAKEIGFQYKTAWQYMDLTDENGEYMLLNLTEGKHVLSLTVTLAGVSEIYDRLNKICAEIGDTYLDVVMITGETPDANRDYELYKQIPEFEEKLTKYYDELTAISKDLNERKDINGELDGAVKNMARVCFEMADNRYSSHLYLETYFGNYQTLSSWLYDIRNMAMSIDKIILGSPETESDSEYANFFQRLGFGIQRFFVSFTSDYSTESLKGSDKSIKIWVNWGRDQVKVLNNLIQQSFSRQSGINVLVEQVNATLVQGIISNNSPDLYLNMARTEPINLAMRGVLYDLSSFDDYEEVLKNFQEGAETPYIYKGKTYALPDTQGFYVMFTRDDILAELGLSVPKTWDEFLAVTSVVQRKNMNTYLPYTRILAANTVNTGAGGLSIFPTMLMQNGDELYNNELNATKLTSPVSVATFKKWTEMYTDYKLNPDINFYQRFRVGTVPIGITTYSQYLTFAVAASEIEGKWSVHAIPGVEQEDGTINNVCSGSGTGCGIMKSSKNKEAAWEFIKWWVSEDTQYNYSANVEAILGQSGRIATSNVNALARLSWDKDALNVILEQWKNVKEIPEVPGSYYVSRSIDQAFWAVYGGDDDYKTAITDWGKTSDNEIERKIAEYAGKEY